MKTTELYRIFIVIYLMFSFFGICNSQPKSTCFTEQQLIKLQKSSIEEINTFLTKEGWSKEKKQTNQTNLYFDYNLDFNLEKWEQTRSIDWEATIFIYFKNQAPNLIIYQTIHLYYDSILKQNPSQKIQKAGNGFKSFISDQNDMTIEFRDYGSTDKTNKRFSILVYNKPFLNKLIQIERSNREAEEVKEKVRKDNFKYAFETGNNYYLLNKFEDAIIQYELAKESILPEDSKTFEDIELRIANSKNGIIQLAYKNYLTEGDQFFEQKKFEDAIIQYELAKKYILSNDTKMLRDTNQKIEKCKKGNIQFLLKNSIESGDRFFEQKKFNEAITQYELAKKYLFTNDLETCDNINSKIAKCKSENIMITFQSYIKSGDQFFEQKDFGNAIFNYNRAFKIDEDNWTLNEKIKNVKNIMNTIELQKKEQIYSRINSTEFNQFKETNYKILNDLMEHYSKDEGKLSYTTLIKFDYLGNNQSNLIINNATDENLKFYLKNNINVSKITSSQRFGYYIPTKEVLDFNLSWNTDKIRAIVKSKKIKIDRTEYFNYKYDNKINSFIAQQHNNNGTYTFDVITKKLNNDNYEDVRLKSYRYNSGPMKFMYSMFMPGWGTKKVSDGKKGNGRMTLFLLSTALSVGSKLFSDNQYEMYKNEFYESKKDTYYENADIANKVFLISGGIAATIYINDILYVFGKGIKNNTQSRYLKEKLRNGPISLVESPLSP